MSPWVGGCHSILFVQVSGAAPDRMVPARDAWFWSVRADLVRTRHRYHAAADSGLRLYRYARDRRALTETINGE